MLITTNENIKPCYLALQEWTKTEGYNIRVGEFGFFVVFGDPENEENIHIVEEYTGTSIMQIPYDKLLYASLENKTDRKRVLEFTASYVKEAIEHNENFKDDMINIKQQVTHLIGEMPS